MSKKLNSFFILFLTSLALTSCASWKQDREKADLYLRMGSSLLEEGNYANALSALLKAHELDPQNPLILNNLGQVYFMRERYDLAEKQFKSAIKLQPDYTDAHNNLARVLIEEGKYTEAESELKLVISDLTYGAIDRAYINLGLLKFNKKEYSKAENAFRTVLKSKPDDCIATSYYGMSVFEQLDYSRAAEVLDRAIGFCQKQLYDEPHFFSALAYFRMGEKNKSIARFEEILKYYPDGKHREKAKGMLELIRKGNQ
jgi:Tfp pilus assembly protein PilF